MAQVKKVEALLSDLDEAHQLLEDGNHHPSALLEELNPEAIEALARSKGIDFATAFLFERFHTSSRLGKFIAEIDHLRLHPLRGKSPLGKLVIAPGGLYRERPDLGGDGAIVRDVAHSKFLNTEIIPVKSSGSVSENALIIRKWLAECSATDIVLVSLSKGGAEVRQALNLDQENRIGSKIRTWINVCGPLQGTRIADWVVSNLFVKMFIRMQFWFQKRDFQFVTELTRDHAHSPLGLDFTESKVPLINVVGFPLKRHLSTSFSRFCHARLSPWGPNDGTVSLGDVIRWPGLTYPAWGMDHYFRPEDQARQLIRAILEYLEIRESFPN
jgi:hypothetical protein